MWRFSLILIIMSANYCNGLSQNYIECLGGKKPQNETMNNENFCSWVDDERDILGSNCFPREPVKLLHDDESLIYEAKGTSCNLTTTASFAILSPFAIEFFMNGDFYARKIYLENRNSSQWIDYTFFLKNHTLLLYENHKMIRYWDIEDHILKINAVTKNTTIFKTYKYVYNWVSNVAKNDSRTLSVRSSENSTLTLSMSMCEDCFLTITSPNGTETEIENNNNASNFWRNLTFEIQANQTKTFIFDRRKMNSSNGGFWKIHGRLVKNAGKDMETSAVITIVIIITLIIISLATIVITIRITCSIWQIDYYSLLGANDNNVVEFSDNINLV